MAYSIPTAADFKARYPAFSTVEDATATIWLVEGDSETINWPDADRSRAVMLYAAHRLSEQGLGDSTPLGVTSFKSGTFSATVESSQASRIGYDATRYGRELVELMNRNFTTPIMAWEPGDAR